MIVYSFKVALFYKKRIYRQIDILGSQTLEKLHGDREGQMSIHINDQWRICFRWEDGDCYDVEITDYH